MNEMIGDDVLGEIEAICGGDLKKGDHGDAVAAAQRALVAAGFMTDPGADIGTFGPKTKAAVEAFQRVKGLRVDGIIGPETSAVLLDPFAAPRPMLGPNLPPKSAPMDPYATPPGAGAGSTIVTRSAAGGAGASTCAAVGGDPWSFFLTFFAIFVLCVIVQAVYVAIQESERK